MPPYLALTLWFVCLMLLLKFDPAKEPMTSAALWVPVIAFFIIGSRSPMQWLDGVSLSSQALDEGSPGDRAISLILILLAVGVLQRRSFKWREFLARNIALTVMIAFGFLSIIWSDFPFVAFKRWIRDMGNFLFILVILSDPNPFKGICSVLRRVFYLLIPLSILLDKYFPAYGRSFSEWTGEGFYQGAATSKNMLGLICLVSGLFFIWDSAARWRDRKQRRTKRILFVNVAFLFMTLSLLVDAKSTTSSVCLLLGALVIVAAYSKVFRRRPGLLKVLIPGCFLLFLLLSFGFDMSGSLAQGVGKDPTMTDRTKIWAFLLSMHTNPLIGTGYQSFWLGPRLELFWHNSGLGHLNSAHNGYLSVYLDQGLIGVGLLSVFLISSYRLICRRLTQKADIAVLGLAGWICIVFYNMSEASLGGGLLYLMFLMLGISAPMRVRQPDRHEALIEAEGYDSGFAEISVKASEITRRERAY